MTQFDSEYPDRVFDQSMEKLTLITKPQPGYELLDSGGEEKLERFGDYVLARPDPQALWPKLLGAEEWLATAGRYERSGKDGVWKLDNTELGKGWPIEFGGLKFLIKPTSFKHVGLFPEQLSNWEWMKEILSKAPAKGRDERDPNSLLQDFAQAPQVLNLFGYTGGATLAAAAAGAEVTHVDASKTAVAWARENAKLSGLEDAPIRWIVEDVLVYLKRELKRGKKYDAIVMDPPAFGHGPKDELWKFEEHFLELMQLCQEILSDKPLFVVINGYAAGYSPLAFAYNLSGVKEKFGGSVEYGDLAIEEAGDEDAVEPTRQLPAGIFARWKGN